MARVCVDACFMIGLYDEGDQHHGAAVRHFDALFGEESGRNQLVAPWPILYECLGTKFAKNPRKSTLFTQLWEYLNGFGQLVLLDDEPYRELLLHEHLKARNRALSLVDRVIRAMILDRKHFFDFFLTYNTPDFVDACRIGDIPLINQDSPAESYGI